MGPPLRALILATTDEDKDEALIISTSTSTPPNQGTSIGGKSFATSDQFDAFSDVSVDSYAFVRLVGLLSWPSHIFRPTVGRITKLF